MIRHARTWNLGWASILIAGCAASRYLDPGDLPFVYKIDIQQGNVVTQEMLAQLEPGMDKTKVRFIMGTPLVIDVFHQDRWDYVYTFQPGGGQRVGRRLSLFFEGERLVKVDGGVKRAAGRIAREPRREVTVEVPVAEKLGLLERIWSGIGLGGREKAAEGAAGEANPAATIATEPLEPGTTPQPPARDGV